MGIKAEEVKGLTLDQIEKIAREGQPNWSLMQSLLLEALYRLRKQEELINNQQKAA